MEQADIHILGSKRGYTTLAATPSVSGSERAELEILSFADATSTEARSRLERHPAMLGRPLRSGRFAISRMLPGAMDDAGRPTIEVVSLVMGEPGYHAAIRALPSLARDSGFWSAARAAGGDRVSLPDAAADRGTVDEAVLRAFDLWMAARREGKQGVMPESESETLFRLLAHLDAADLARCRWGAGLLSLSGGAEILTYAQGTTLVGARGVLRLAAPGEWHTEEMGQRHQALAWHGRLPASTVMAERQAVPSTRSDDPIWPGNTPARTGRVPKLRATALATALFGTLLLAASAALVVAGPSPNPSTGESAIASAEPPSSDVESRTSERVGGSYGPQPPAPSAPVAPPPVHGPPSPPDGDGLSTPPGPPVPDRPDGPLEPPPTPPLPQTEPLPSGPPEPAAPQGQEQVDPPGVPLSEPMAEPKREVEEGEPAARECDVVELTRQLKSDWEQWQRPDKARRTSVEKCRFAHELLPTLVRALGCISTEYKATVSAYYRATDNLEDFNKRSGAHLDQDEREEKRSKLIQKVHVARSRCDDYIRLADACKDVSNVFNQLPSERESVLPVAELDRLAPILRRLAHDFTSPRFDVKEPKPGAPIGNGPELLKRLPEGLRKELNVRPLKK